ncbi:MAG: type II toxin-antitoxin system VapC family toxin [Sedimenticolaceae bacterium]
MLDTHVLIWLDAGTTELGDETAELIDGEFAVDGVAVSAISFWEIAMLIAKGRVVIAQPLLRWREELLAAGLRELPLDGRLGIEAAELSNFHGDPADRFIVASASTLGCKLVTADRRILAWRGSIEAVDARR